MTLLQNAGTSPSLSMEEQEHPLKGIAYMLLSTVLFGGADTVGKLLTANYPFMQIVFLRSILGMAVVAVFMLFNGGLGQLRTQTPRWHLARSLVGIMLTTGMLTGLKYIPLAEVTSIVFATPILVAMYSSFFLKETISKGTYIAIILGFAGVILVVRPSPDHFHPAHLFMLGFACSAAFLAITARKLLSTESVLTLNFYLYPAAILISVYPALSQWQAPDLQDWGLFLLISLFATLALFCTTKAVHFAKPAQVAPFDYIRIIWTLAIGYYFWGEFPDNFTWIGIVIIILCGLYIVTRRKSARAKVPVDATIP